MRVKMEFCEKCGGLIDITGDKAKCVSCGHTLKRRPSLKTSEKVSEKTEIAVVEDKKENVHPVVPAKCPKCKHNEAYFWTQQTRSSDESETKFYKCTKCGHAWRVYR
ncbi:transcription factor S [Candidatus Pacearchaeota archaeon]|nr:MAG: transcription factor S [Candidatus Pacearchaeota archaeon]